MKFGRCSFALFLLAAGCGAQALRPPLIVLPAVPAEPGWNWIVRYATARLENDLAQWPNQLQAIAADGNHLTAAQEGDLQSSLAPVSASMGRLRIALAQPFSINTCPKQLGEEVLSLGRQVKSIERDVVPPWTRQNHQPAIQSMSSSLLGFDNELGCFPNTTPPQAVAAASVSPPTAYTGVVRGRALADRSRAPLPDTYVFLKGVGLGLSILGPAQNAGLNANARIDEQVITPATGEWAFTGIPPGCYLLTAAHAGRLPVFDKVTVSSSRARDCQGASWFAFYANQVGDAPPSGAISRLLAPSGVSSMAYGPLVAAFPMLQRYLRFENVRFSPDAKAITFRVDKEAEPGEWSLWKYDLDSGELQSLGPAPAPRPGSNPAAIPTAGLRFEMVSPAWSPAPDEKLRVGHSAIWAQRLENGVHLFISQLGGSPRSLAVGGGNLYSTIIDSARKRAYFPDYDHAILSIYSFDTGKTQQRELPTRAESLLAAAPVPGGVVLAYLANGSCDHLDRAFPPLSTARICFLKVPDANAN